MTAPFGIALGSTPKASDAAYNVIFTQAPKTHPLFPLVVGQWIPEKGLCQITGYSRWMETGAHTLAMQSEYENIKDQLDHIYGDYADVRECAFAVARLNLFEYVSLPASTEIINGVIWRADTGARLPSDLDHIMLMIQALSDFEARICLTYAAFRDDVPLGDVL